MLLLLLCNFRGGFCFVYKPAAVRCKESRGLSRKRNNQKRLAASSGNRTRAARVAGEHSTTEPSMLYTQGCLPDAALLAFLAGQGSRGAPNMRLSNFSMKTSRHFSECHTALSKNRMLKKNINAVGRIRTYARRAELISSQSP